MLYFIKFIYETFLLPPGIFIIILVVSSARLFYKKHYGMAAILTAVTLLFYFCTTPLVSQLMIHPLENEYQPPKLASGDVIVMLGGGATLDTPNFDEKGHLSGEAANRLLTCLQLYRQLKVPILISGGQVYKTTGREAEIAENILGDVGIPAAKIIVENKSLNTADNARFTQLLLDKHKYSRPLLVTSAFHMPRAVRQFQKYGVKVMPYPTAYHVNIKNRFGPTELIPSAGALSDFSLALKEYLGLLAIKWY